MIVDLKIYKQAYNLWILLLKKFECSFVQFLNIDCDHKSSRWLKIDHLSAVFFFVVLTLPYRKHCKLTYSI